MFESISEFITEKIISVHIPRFSEFTALNLKDLNELDEYLHKKVEIGRKLQLCETIIVQGLTDSRKP